MKIRMFALLSLILIMTLFMLGGLIPTVAQSQPLSRTGLPPASGMDTPTFTQATTDTISTDDASSLGSNWVVDYEKGQRIVLMHDGSITSTWEANQKGPLDDGTTTIKPLPDADFSGLTYSLPFGEIELDSVGINGINLSKSSETLPSNLRMGNGTCARQVYTESSDLRTTKTPGGLLTGHLEVTKWPYPSYGWGEKRIYNYTSDAYIEYTDLVIPDFPPGSNVEIYQGFNFLTGNGVATHQLLISTVYGDFTLPWSTDPVWLGPFPADPGITDVHLDADAPWDSQHYWPGLEDFHMLLFAEGEKRPSVIYAFTLSELEQPQLDLPSHNQQLFGESVTLSWQPFTVMDHVSSYVFELSDNEQFIDPLLSVSEPALGISVNMLAPYNQGFTYYWRVRAVSDCAGLEGPWSEVRAFSLLPQSLSTPTLISPVNDLCVEGTDVAFEWTGSSLANQYGFQIAEEPTFPDDDSTTTYIIELENPYPDDFSLTLQGLPYNSDGYYWRVAYGLNQVWGDFSAVGSFSNQSSCEPATRLQFKLTASDPGTADYFAKSVDIDGTFAIVGALYHDEVAPNSGAAYIFERDESGWDEQSELIASDAESKDLFGASVAINGDYALVGAPDADHRDGAAYIFKRDGESWTQQAKLIPNPENQFARRRFGSSVDISGDYAIVGVRYAGLPNYGGSNAGAAYIFKREGEEWVEQKILYASDGAAQDGFGGSVAIDGDYAIVGAPYNDDDGNNSGAAYIFARNGSDWVQQGSPLTASNAAAEDRFGVVAISGDVAVVGAPVRNRDENRAGNAYVFVRNGESWSEQAQLSISDALAGNNFGYSVAIDGDTVVVAARFEHYHTGDWLDGAYLFTRQGNNWPQQDKLVSSDLGAYDRFGESVAINGGRIIVGAPADDDNGHYTSGSAYIFE